MTTPRHPRRRPPRVIRTMEGLADYLDHGVSWLRERIQKWEAIGFPTRDDELDGWDIRAIDVWIDGRSSLLAPSERLRHERAALDEEFGIGDGSRAISRNKAA